MNTLDDLKLEAQDLVRQFARGEFADAERRFDRDLSQAMPATRLRDEWRLLLDQVGPFREIVSCRAVERQDNRLVLVSCQFEKTAIDFHVAYNLGGEITGLRYLPTPAASSSPPPDYADLSAFHEVEVTVGSGAWSLPGTLSVPTAVGPFPAVVLVHGSGPQDRDETIGPLKPFRDLAWGLASRGIAVLRYDKRTKVYGATMTPEVVAGLTVRAEVVDDALAGVRLLRQTPEIDPNRTYVLGHSLGATLAPWIGAQVRSIAGLIIMAGMTRRLEDTILDQYTYVYHQAGPPTEAQEAELAQLRVKVARVKDPNLSTTTPAKDLPLDVPPAYWLALRDYRPDEVATTLSIRILVLQGGRDYQVTPTGDFPAWQAALGDKPNATLTLYPELNHLFIAGEGPATPQDYWHGGHVSAAVVQDIARWIRMVP